MLRLSPCSLSLALAVAACTSSSGGGLDTAYTSSTSTSGEGSESGELEETGTEETETGTDTDGEPEGEPLRFIAAGSDDAVVLALDLTDPHDIPEAQYLATGDGFAGLFGPTPFGTEALTHSGKIQQLRLTAGGELELSPLAEQDGNWLHGLWFGDQGADAFVSPSDAPLSGSNTLLWVRYDQHGELLGSFDITPPKQPGGYVSILARSPDSRWVAAAVDAQPNGSWDLYVLPIDVEPGMTVHVDTINLAGIPPISVASFLSLHLDDQRLVYRREQLPEIFRPVAVDLGNPEAPLASVGTTLAHTYSITTAPGDASRLLVTNGGSAGYRELRLIELDGPTSAQPPVLITEPNKPAQENASALPGTAASGHGFDVLGRIWYVYRDTTQPQLGSVGISLVTVEDGEVAQRLELANLQAGAELDEVLFDPERQLLGFRVYAGNSSSINYVDLSRDRPASIRVDQSYEHSGSAPSDHARYGWSADGSRIAVVGVKQNQAVLHVAEIGDAAGATVEITLPEVERTLGYTLEHQPMLSPGGDQLLLWYGTPSGLRGLIHAPTDGSAAGSVVLAPQHALTSGAYLPHTPE
ncbi:MAG: hypothetical protein R6X02_02250 [Enhygromyxa sp.]